MTQNKRLKVGGLFFYPKRGAYSASLSVRPDARPSGTHASYLKLKYNQDVLLRSRGHEYEIRIFWCVVFHVVLYV